MSIAVRIINKLLKKLECRIVPLSKFQLAIEYLIRENKEIKFIQVGANDGVRFDDLYFTVTSQKWRGILLEPLPHLYARLVSNYQDHKQIIPINVGIHPSSKNVSIYHVGKNELSSYPDWAAGIASFSKEHLIRHGINENHIDEKLVECQTLKQVIGDHDFHDLDFLQVDTEGFDYEVIKTIDFNKSKPRLIKFEWMNLSGNDQREITNLLVRNGYKVRVEKDGSDCIAWLKDKLSF